MFLQQTWEGTIRLATDADVPAMLALWNQSVAAQEVVFASLTPQTFRNRLMQPESCLLVAQAGQQLAGWLHAAVPQGGEAYLTAIFVHQDVRRQGIGRQLMASLESRMCALGKQVLAVSGNNPVKTAWCVPGTPGHDHNNAPGVDEACAGYPFLQAVGMAQHFCEVAMYRNLAGYAWPSAMDDIHKQLANEGITVGLYDGKQTLAYEGMCDRVGSEYWRGVLRQELHAWQSGVPCEDATLWADGLRPQGPRPLLMAIHGDQIVGFTGPVDKQQSGRGWFTGICVDPLYGKRSIGALLFEMLLRQFVAQGATFSTLFTGSENHAQRIYLRAGFTPVRRFAVMVKPLAQGAQYEGVLF